MTWSAGAQRASISTYLVATYFALIAVLYGIAWFLPAAALDHDAALNLVTAKAIAAGHGYVVDSVPTPVSETSRPPLFSAVLALFVLVSSNAQWLKLAPVASTAGWLALTYRLLLRMGASKNGALVTTGLAAASPMVLFLGTNLVPESLFALLTTGALLALLDERAFLAGVLAGLATLTQTAGVALIAACVITLLARRRFQAGATLALTSTVIAAPWFGWSLAHLTHDLPLQGVQSASNIFTGLAANEKAVVVGHNLWDLFASPISLLTGYSSASTIALTAVVLGWCFVVRRQTVPDLFLLLYSLVLVCRVAPPERSIAAVLPFVFWVAWRALRRVGSAPALAAIAVIVAIAPLGPDVVRIARARAAGNLSSVATPPNNWYELDRQFAFLRSAASVEDVVISDNDSAFFLSTGRKAVRGFVPAAYELSYAPQPVLVTPDQLSRAIIEQHAGWVSLTPDRGLRESPSFHQSVEALERGGIIEPVMVPGAGRDYRLFRLAGR
ncbi:MAG TPA: hypothetical protein VG297_01405 [Bryobacteraceae bacterium]|jgi:hypothetical protein|nr:hypothetical protein [Bryobacteraceae bacterium]